ncbi:MAG: RHS repeat protein [Clostridia bacterium]|nr:RHS repeat protein [Clostridia bacterium]
MKLKSHIGFKAVAFVLVFAIVATLIPVRFNVIAFEDYVPTVGNEAVPDLSYIETKAESAPDALFEVSDLRSSNSKTLRFNDGTFALGTYGFNVHFPTTEGFVEYDNTLICENSRITTTRSDVDISFGIEKPSYSFSCDGLDVSFELINEGIIPSCAEISELPKQEYSTKSAELFAVPAVKAQLDYKNILDGVSFSYLIYGRNIKESIIFDSIPLTNEFKYHIATEDSIYLDDDGYLRVGDALIPPAFMVDSTGVYSDAVEYSLETANDGYILTITPSKEWLESDERVFPVVLDPTLITDSPTHGDVSDGYVKSAQPNFNSNYYYLMHVGNDSTDPQMYVLRSYIKINNLPEIPKASRILSATISLQQAENGYWYSFDSSYSNYLTVTAKEVTSSWSESTLTWNNQPSFSDKVLDYVISCSDTAERYLNFDITTCMQKWYENSNTNFGIVLQSATEQYDGFTTFISTDDVIFSDTNPSFYITYYDTKGIESRWAFVAEDAGTAGTAYVNLYNGMPALTGPGLGTQDELLPLSVYPVYNGYLSGMQFAPNSSVINAPVTADFGASAGCGFKLSCWESLTYKTIGGESYFCYNDADGTELYFRSYPGIGYISEDGYDLTLSLVMINPYYYSISDSDGNSKYFDIYGKLTLITDEYGNKKMFNYDAQGRITSISFQSKTMLSAETQLSFSYNNGNALTRITNAKDSSIYLDFLYSATVDGPVSQSNSGYLRKLVYSTGDFAEYEYDSVGRLTYMKQGKTPSAYGTYVSLEYNNDGRVSSILQRGADDSLGNRCSFEYSHKKAIVRTSGADDIHGNTDDLLSVYLFDNYGNTICSYLTNLDGDRLYGASSAEYTENDLSTNPKANNSIVKAGARGEYSSNLIANGNLEYTYGWASSCSFVTVGTSSTEFMFGAKSVYMNGESSICSGTLSQSVTVSDPGTYTLCAYVKSSMTMGFQYSGSINGAYVSLDGTKSEIIDGATDTSVQNGWRMISVTKTFSSAGTYTAELSLQNMQGSVYFDGITLIKGEAPATEFNYIPNSWINLANVSLMPDGSTKLSCDPGDSAYGYLLVEMNKPASSAAFNLSGWSKGYSVPEEDTSDYPFSMINNSNRYRFWGLSAVIRYTDGTEETQAVSFNPAVSGEWQYASTVIIPSSGNSNKTISRVLVYINYINNANYALFKDVSLSEADACAYEYDSEGNVVSIRNTENSSALTYSGKDVTGVTDSQGNSASYTYVPNKHKVLTASDAQGLTATYGYNTNGLSNSVIYTPSSGNDQASSSAVYNDYGNLISETDTLSNTTSYGYNTDRGLINYINNANNHRMQYVYDLGGKLTEIFADIDKDGVRDSGEAGVSYTYDSNNYLTDIYNGATTYHFFYDTFGNITSITIGTNTTPLVSYSYANNNGKLLSSTYSDGTVISNTYDELNRIKSVSYNGIVAYTITYDGKGNISSYTDCATGRTYKYEYDVLGRTVRFFVTQNGNELYAAEKFYDSNGRSTGHTYTIGGVGSRTSTSTYDQYNRLSQETTAGGDTVSYTYDGFGRVIAKTTGNYSEHYEYLTSGSNTSTIVSKVTVKYGGSTVKTVRYTYDNLGNILTEDDGTTVREFTYDSLNQLATEKYYDKITFNGEYRVYSMSQNGNVSYFKFALITGMPYSVGTSGHLYGNGTDWKELLTSFANVQITYDANGNPLSYYNGQSYTFTWQKGRQLASSTVGSDVITYAYDISGLRISKSVNGTTHTYTYDGSMLLCDKWGNEYIEYFYDASGSPYALRYFNGTSYAKYYYVKNAECDILELRNTANTLVATYIYDGWGKLVSVIDGSGNAITSQTHIANLNILRYRGYVYDTETKLYYLQSRYYDPQTQRFISPDSYVSTGQGIVGNNMFAYCNNNPANMIDLFGEDAIWLQERLSVNILGNTYGHSGLMVQAKDGTWYYFYWGPKANKGGLSLLFPVFNGAKLIKLTISDDSLLHSTSGIKQILKENMLEKWLGEDRIDNLTDSLYYYGDYSETYKYCDTAIRKGYYYKLYTYNCMQASADAMSKSNRDFLRIVDKSKLDFIPNHMLSEVKFLWGRQRTSTFLRLKNIEKLTELTFKKRIW